MKKKEDNNTDELIKIIEICALTIIFLHEIIGISIKDIKTHWKEIIQQLKGEQYYEKDKSKKPKRSKKKS